MDKKIRIVCADPVAAENLINELLKDYAPIVWNIQPGPDGVIVTCVLISEAELRKAQLLTGAIPQRLRP
ncbi:MAG TPA: hypothetical protein VGH29_00955 [Candidatus Binataceae bacterium]|jgi:hypothetical protein